MDDETERGAAMDTDWELRWTRTGSHRTTERGAAMDTDWELRLPPSMETTVVCDCD